MDLTPWQPYKLTFCPINYYVDGSLKLNADGELLKVNCAILDTILLTIMEKV